MLSLRAAGVGHGDEVILSSHTYIATAASVHFVGATPMLVECGVDHMIDPKSVEMAIRDKTRVIMPTQLNGRTCDMDALQAIADKHGLVIIEDAAQALSSMYKAKCAGTFGLAGTFSFYPAKLLGCFGDGGAVVTNDDNMAKRVALLRDHGRNEEGVVVTWGTNCRLDNIQAAILNLKLWIFDISSLWEKQCPEIGKHLIFTEKLRGKPAPKKSPKVKLPPPEVACFNCPKRYPVTCLFEQA